MKVTKNIVINGMGGEGIILCGDIIAKALHKNNRDIFVAQNPNYGPQARGGFSQSTLIISDEPILYPLVDIADILIFTGQKGLDIKPQLNTNGIIITDEGLAIEKYYPCSNHLLVPLRRTVQELGNERGLNVLIIGLLYPYLEEYISYVTLTRELGNYFTSKSLELNIKTMDLGRDMLRKN